MKASVVLLLLILVFIIACLVATGIHYSMQGRTYEIKPIYTGSAEENPVTAKVMNKLQPYLKEVGESAHVEDYLTSFLEYPASRIKSIQKNADSNHSAPSRHKFLYMLIDDILFRYDIGNVEDFLDKTHLTYSSFVPAEKRCLLMVDAPLVTQINDKDRKLVRTVLDNYLSDAGHYLTKSRLNKQADDFLLFNKLFKFKSDKVAMPIGKLRELAKKSPEKVYEVDVLGLRPALWQLARSYGSDNRDTDLIRQLKRDIERLKLLRDYPTLYISDVKTVDELATRLRLAAEGLAGQRSRSAFLADLGREREELRRIAAERRAAEEQTKRLAAENERRRIAAEKEQETERRRRAEAREAELEHQRLVREEQERAQRDQPQEQPEQPEQNQLTDAELLQEAKEYSMKIPEGDGIDFEVWKTLRRQGLSPETIIGMYEQAVAGGLDFRQVVGMSDIDPKDNIVEE